MRERLAIGSARPDRSGRGQEDAGFGQDAPVFRAALSELPLLSASMAAAITGGGRAAVQRNLALMEARGLIREVTGRGDSECGALRTEG